MTQRQRDIYFISIGVIATCTLLFLTAGILAYIGGQGVVT